MHCQTLHVKVLALRLLSGLFSIRLGLSGFLGKGNVMHISVLHSFGPRVKYYRFS